jgi:hypothetical protein
VADIHAAKLESGDLMAPGSQQSFNLLKVAVQLISPVTGISVKNGDFFHVLPCRRKFK